MIQAQTVADGIEVVFADGRCGTVPSADIPEVGRALDLVGIELPNPYVVVLRTKRGDAVELPWDLARHYCDVSYRPRIEAVGVSGRQAIGRRIRQARERAGLTQEALAAKAEIGRVTLVRIENGAQSPRYETLVSLAKSLGTPLRELLVDEERRA